MMADSDCAALLGAAQERIAALNQKIEYMETELHALRHLRTGSAPTTFMGLPIDEACRVIADYRARGAA